MIFFKGNNINPLLQSTVIYAYFGHAHLGSFNYVEKIILIEVFFKRFFSFLVSTCFWIKNKLKVVIFFTFQPAFNNKKNNTKN
jgi:hypothetical protein